MLLEYPSPALTDGVVRLRPWADTDLECVREAAADESIPAGTTVPAIFTPEEGRAFIQRQHARMECGEGVSLAIAEARADEAVGLVWLAVRPQPGVTGLGYWVVPSARRRGYGTRAVRLAADWALRRPAARRIEAWVEPENLASQRLLAAAGFGREGVLSAFLKVGERRVDAVVFTRLTDDAQ